MTAVDPSLVTIETVERLIGKAYDLIRQGKAAEAALVLQAAVEETTRRTVSAIKDQGTSDEVTRLARERVRLVMAQMEREHARTVPSVVRRAVLEHYAPESVSAYARILKAVRDEFPGMSLSDTIVAVNDDLAAHGLVSPMLASHK